MAEPPASETQAQNKRRCLWSRRQIVILLGLSSILAAVAIIRLAVDRGWGAAPITIDPTGRTDFDPALAINIAGWPSLSRLPGLGPKTAQAVVTEREANGPFRDGADLIARVRGIGPATFAKFRAYIRFMPESRPSDAP